MISTTPLFHPAVAGWFTTHFGEATAAQTQAWPAITSGRNVLIAAPTGSGKTLAAFLSAIDRLVRDGLAGALSDETHVLYVSPLKALSNDVQKNLQVPLAGISKALREQHLPDVEIRTWVRTGDTPASERDKARKRPPHIVVTTPESFYILLGSESGRAMLKNVRTVIVDEIHAIAGTKRGSHLALSLERLDALCGRKVVRVGLSATQKPISTIAQFLVGTSEKCAIVDIGHSRARDLALEVPPSPLEAVMSGEQWKQVYERLAQLITDHKTTLVFVNTRRMVERAARELSERLGENDVAAHHGSLSREQRFDAEQRLKHGKLRVLVATASLELGIDIGDVDLVCQLGSPRSIAAFLQRVGRSGHAVSGTPKGRLFPLSRDELVECTALLDSVKRGELDRIIIPHQPLDVLAQQIVAEVAAQDWNDADLRALVRRAWPYRELKDSEFRAVVAMLADGFNTNRGRRGALIHHDAINHVLRGRRGARLTAITSGGAIPDNADYRVLLEPENQFIGTVHEDFAVESLAGDVFQLGNQSYQILRVERGVVRVENAHGQPPTIPFWLGEAPGRSDELSQSVARLRATVARTLETKPEALDEKLNECLGMTLPAEKDLAGYLAASHAALGCLPTQDTLVFERFFDESGGMQLVIHSPYGSRINRAWGLALRKRFCRKFNFELQAAATEDNIVLSLTGAHSFDLPDVANYLKSKTVRAVLTEALLDAPMFTTRWRWVAGTALALPRYRGGKKRAPQLLRMDAEDLLCAVFPDQVACAENLPGKREIPDHPLVNQTIYDCLHEAMDIEGLETMLRRLEAGEIRVVARDLTEPSPLALEVLSARPYAYLDDAPLEERRTQAVQARRWMAPESAADLGRLDIDAIARVREETWPDPRNADELHDSLAWLGFMTEAELAALPHGNDFVAALVSQGRSALLMHERTRLWIAAERAAQFRAIWPDLALQSAIGALPPDRAWTREEAITDLVRSRLAGEGPTTSSKFAAVTGLSPFEIDAAFYALETEGYALRGRFTPGANDEEWCERGLLARIHRYTLKRLRAEIEPVPARDFMRFLFAWQRVTVDERAEGVEAVASVLAQLEGFEAPAAAWESEILPTRISNYSRTWLDELCRAGRVAWTSLRRRPERVAPAPIRTTPIVFMQRREARFWLTLSPLGDHKQLTSKAQSILAYIREHGASFYDEIVDGTGLMRTYAEEGLAELVSHGVITSDSFAGLRVLLRPAAKRDARMAAAMQEAGRWALINRGAVKEKDPLATEHIAHALLKRYGVVFWRLLEREASWLPSWRELLYVFRRMEARGDIRGGRFVAGFAGEQFALPEAVGALRDIRRRPSEGEFVSISAADPLNFVGILTPGAKLPVLTRNRVLFKDGVPVAVLARGEVTGLSDAPVDWEIRKRLLRSASARRDTAITRDAMTEAPPIGILPSAAKPASGP